MKNDVSQDTVLKLYDKISTSEQHFNSLQLEYRKLSSVWLLAMFGGIGFLLAKIPDTELTTRIILIGFISFGGAIGICLIWLLDLVVYHRLLRAYFLTGLLLEKQYKEYLPPTRSIMRHLDSNKKQILNHVVTYYFLTSLICFVISISAFSSLNHQVCFLNDFYFYPGYWMWALSIVTAGIYIYLLYTTVVKEHIQNEISNFKFDVNSIVKKDVKNNNIKRIVITGGPGSGKTTLIQVLRELGYPTVSESALVIIDQLNSLMGVKAQMDWRALNKDLFQEYICKLGELQENIIASLSYNEIKSGQLGKIIFFDRGMHDGMAYYKDDNAIPSFLKHVTYDFHYDAIFVLETPATFASRESTGRTTLTHEASQEAGDRHKACYEKYFPGRVFTLPSDANTKTRLFEILKDQGII
jgi:predicted ATPase